MHGRLRARLGGYWSPPAPQVCGPRIGHCVCRRGHWRAGWAGIISFQSRGVQGRGHGQLHGACGSMQLLLCRARLGWSQDPRLHLQQHNHREAHQRIHIAGDGVSPLVVLLVVRVRVAEFVGVIAELIL